LWFRVFLVYKEKAYLLLFFYVCLNYSQKLVRKSPIDLSIDQYLKVRRPSFGTLLGAGVRVPDLGIVVLTWW
jgi:hypothetical protein